jgi:ABC-type transport system involved in multi-copper enzyme maturation permease subunit
MTPFKALIIKDLQANRKVLMVPIWFLLGMYVILIASITIGYATGNTNMSVNGIPLDLLANENLHKMMSFVMQSAMFIGSLGLIFAISMAIISATLLNQDIKHKCELFHRSQPVNVWQITASRFIAGIGGLLALSLAIGIFNMILSNILASILTPMRVDWWMSLNGLVLSWLHFSIAMTVLGSILFVFSAIFRDNAFGLGVGSLGVLQLITLILNKVYGWHLPYILNAIYKLIMSGILKISNVLPTSQQFGIITVSSGQEPNLVSFVLPDNFLYNLWTTLFTWDIAFKFLFCAVMFVIATYLYKRREVQF